MTRSLSAISLCMFGVVSLLLNPACSSGGKSNQEEEALEPALTGNVRLALTARGQGGALFRLRDTFFNVQRDDFGFFTQLFTENDPAATTIEQTLPVGTYFIDVFSNFGQFTLDKIEGGQTSRVNATLLSPSRQIVDINTNEETQLGYRFETNGEVVEFGEGRLVITLEVDERAGEARRGVIENSQAALGSLTLRDTLAAALRNSGTAAPVSEEDVYHAIIDSYNTAPGFQGDLRHCDDQRTQGNPSLNGFPLTCPRLEGQQFFNLDSWVARAVVNRLDLAPSDGSNCGQQRIVFSNNSFIGASRMFLIVEAEVPNPTPECGVSACLPLAEFWSSLATVADAGERGNLLRQAFLDTGVGPFGPFINATHLGPDGGQIRTNNFNDFTWTLREFHMQPDPVLLPLPNSVGEAPNGELWNDNSPLVQGEACRSSFLASIPNLLSDNLATLGFPVAEACEDAESPNDFFRQDYGTHLFSGTGNFAAAIDAQIAGTGLSAFDIASRARFAGSCIGCHNESSGAGLGHGVVAPSSFDFVHVSENTETCAAGGGTCFVLSEAMRTVFLPHRIEVQRNFLASDPTCRSAGPGLEEGGPSGSVDGGVVSAASDNSPQRTLGGQPVTDHAH
jgi:hypothetical protein